MLERPIVTAALVGLLASAGGGPAAAGEPNTGRSPAVELTRTPDVPRPGQLVSHTWHITDGDPFTGVESVLVDYGDGRGTRTLGGTKIVCGEALAARGLDHRFRTVHSYRRAGTYLVGVRVVVRQRLCGVPLQGPEVAERWFRVTIR